MLFLDPDGLATPSLPDFRFLRSSMDFFSLSISSECLFFMLLILSSSLKRDLLFFMSKSDMLSDLYGSKNFVFRGKTLTISSLIVMLESEYLMSSLIIKEGLLRAQFFGRLILIGPVIDF